LLLRKQIAIVVSTAFLAACSHDAPTDTTVITKTAKADTAAVQTMAPVMPTESEKANALFVSVVRTTHVLSV
jgi:uncharacterized lipoprotein YajG